MVEKGVESEMFRSFDSLEGKQRHHDENMESFVGIAIILILIASTIGFEVIKHRIEHAASRRFKVVLNALFGEMTVLGFLSLCTFCVIRTGFFAKMSLKLYGEKEELQEAFEFIHFALFFIMVLFVFNVTVLIEQAKSIEEEWTGICQQCHEPELAELIAKQEAANVETWKSKVKRFFYPEITGNKQFLLYYGLRKEFVLERSMEYPFHPMPKGQRVPSCFNFAMYLDRCLQKTLGQIVEIHNPTWILGGLFSIAFYGFSILVENDRAIMAWGWVGVEWLSFLGCCYFHHHLFQVKQAMAWKVSPSHSNSLDDTETTHLVNEGGFPDWCMISSSKIEASGKRLNRQQMLYWFDEHGPEAYIIILQVNLVFAGVYWTVLALVYFPHMIKHESLLYACVYALAAAAPLPFWQNMAKNLIASITQVISVGYLRKHDAVVSVMRDQKIEAIIRALLILDKVLRSVRDCVERRNSDRSLQKAAASCLDSSSKSNATSTSSTTRTQYETKSSRSLDKLATNEVVRTFDAMDISRTGTIEKEEIDILLSKLGVPATSEMSQLIMNALDTDGDGVISKEEFINFYEEHLLPDTEMPDLKEQAKRLFEIFDTDGSGEISASEFKVTVETFQLGFTLEDIGDILLEVDSDGNGSISLHEFEGLVKKYFPKEASRRSSVRKPPSELNLAISGDTW